MVPEPDPCREDLILRPCRFDINLKGKMCIHVHVYNQNVCVGEDFSNTWLVDIHYAVKGPHVHVHIMYVKITVLPISAVRVTYADSL